MRVFAVFEALAAAVAGVLLVVRMVGYLLSSAPVSCTASSGGPQVCYGALEGPSVALLVYLAPMVLLVAVAVASALVHVWRRGRVARRILWGTALVGLVVVGLSSFASLLLPAAAVAVLAACCSLGVRTGPAARLA